jgi:hypothetical protein
MGDMADAQRVVLLSCRRFAARHEFSPFEGYEPFRAALSPMAFISKQLSRDECLAQAEECRATISTVCNGGTRIMLETMAQRWDRLAEEPQRARA